MANLGDSSLGLKLEGTKVVLNTCLERVEELMGPFEPVALLDTEPSQCVTDRLDVAALEIRDKADLLASVLEELLRRLS